MPRTNINRNIQNQPLGKQLVFAPWFAMKLGYNSVTDMLTKNKDTESHADIATSVLANIIDQIRQEPNYISIEMLRTMDSNIREDLAHINSQRSTPISLKYFQYLAALSAEYMLIRLADSPRNFAKEINTDMRRRMQNLPEYNVDNVAHLSKMAFWMATGSGKTLIMHLNYLQFLRHKIFTPDNIILITPNKEMTEQHLEEMRLSNIPCLSFGESSGIYDNRRQNAVLVMDIHKLTAKEKSKKGVSIPPETFSGRNLAFVDEGHKGASGTAYFDIRDRLTKNGFAFEYSATFGNAIAAIAAKRRQARTEEYARAIAFDYSYGYFHDDGYGKDYYILNMQGEVEDKQDILMLGNLLAFFQQKLAFVLHNAEIQEYKIAPPLLLLLGASVVGGKPKNEDPTPQTDIMKTLAFLRRAVGDKNPQGRPWLCATVRKILSYNSGLTAENSSDLFANKFYFLLERYGDDIEKLCKEMLESVFYTSSPAALKFCPIKKTSRQKGSGEIALRVGDKPFALIYVGDTAKLRALAEDENEFGPNNILEDSIQSPLFPNINRANSPINLLIGAKKFMEGWSSWRVCGIGLLNVGQSEGPLIIQLFGRGVRLRGRNWSLKRSGHLLVSERDSKIKSVLSILETLNIFSINAHFMSQFRKYLKEEGQVWDSISLPVQVLPLENSNDHKTSEEITETEFKNKNLLIPEMPPNDDFDKTVMLEKDEDLGKIQIDLSSSASLVRTGVADATTWQQSKKIIFNQNLIDLDNLYLRMLEKYKNINHSDIIICRKNLPQVLTRCSYLYDNADGLPRGKRLQNVAFDALCQYADKQQSKSRRQWQQNNIKFPRLQSKGKKRHANFADYIVHIRENDADIINGQNLIQRIEEMLKKNTEGLYLRSNNYLPSIYFPEHLYQPLFTEKDSIKFSPPPLNDNEKNFIEKLTHYAKAKNFPEKVNEIYALRNRAKSGVGFCLQDGAMHYPDFILWIIGTNRQRIVFVEPHGMRMSNHYDSEYKARLWESIKDMREKFPKKPQLEMDSYILSVTSCEDMCKLWGLNDWNKDKFKSKNILFAEDLNAPKSRDALFAKMLEFKS